MSFENKYGFNSSLIDLLLNRSLDRPDVLLVLKCKYKILLTQEEENVLTEFIDKISKEELYEIITSGHICDLSKNIEPAEIAYQITEYGDEFEEELQKVTFRDYMMLANKVFNDSSDRHMSLERESIVQYILDIMQTHCSLFMLNKEYYVRYLKASGFKVSKDTIDNNTAFIINIEHMLEQLERLVFDKFNVHIKMYHETHDNTINVYVDDIKLSYTLE